MRKVDIPVVSGAPRADVSHDQNGNNQS